jgi:hypothetical protein
MLFHLYVLGKVSKKRILGTARVIAYGTVVAAGLGALTIHNAVADVRTQSLELGRKLADVKDLLPGANEFRLNGQSVYMSSTTTNESLKTVLDRFQGHCEKSRALEAPSWGASVTAGTAGGAPPELSNAHFGIMRTEDEVAGDGVVMCFTGDDGPKALLSALEEFRNTSDLHAFGNVRYVHASRQKDETLVQSVWTDGSFKLDALIGTPGRDSAGSDFANLPRPINATRTLTAEGVGTPYAVRMYTSTSTAEEVLSAYEKKMENDGWIWVKSPDVGLETNRMDGRWFTRLDTGDQAVVSVSKSDGESKTKVVVGSVAQVVGRGPTGNGSIQ